MKIRLTTGAFAGLVVDHNPHVAHELIRRGQAVEVLAEQPAAPVETATVPEPEHVEHAVARRRGKGRR